MSKIEPQTDATLPRSKVASVEAPRCLQEMAQEAPKMTQEAPKMARSPPRPLQDPYCIFISVGVPSLWVKMAPGHLEMSLQHRCAKQKNIAVGQDGPGPS